MSHNDTDPDRHSDGGDGQQIADGDRAEEATANVSRRSALGLAGLVGAGGLLGTLASQPAAAVEGHTLQQDLNCDGNHLRSVGQLFAGQNYLSLRTRGEGDGNIQLYDENAGAPSLRVSEERESDPGPVIINSVLRGVSPDDTGGDIEPGPLRIADDVDVDGNAVQNVGALAGSVTEGQRLDTLAGQNLEVANGQLDAAGAQVSDELESRLEDAVTRLEVVGGTANKWRAGPASPSGDYHLSGAFGIRIDTDRPAYLGECVIDASDAGQFSPALYEYVSDTGDGSDGLGERIDAITVQARGGPQTVFLDFLLEEPGEYLLTRLVPSEDDGTAAVPDDMWKPADDTIELRASPGYGGWNGDSGNGVTIHGGHNPFYSGMEKPNEKWYYYFDLEVSSASSAE